MAEKAVQIKRDKDRDGEHGEESVAFILTKPVDLGLLGEEIKEAQELEEVPGIVTEGTVSRATAKNPVTLWVLDPDVDATKLRGIVSKHELPLNEFEALALKAQDGEKLTEDEIQTALRLLLLRVR